MQLVTDPDECGLGFTEPLIAWYRKNKRSLPWRDSGDPYLIWISEIMLQQTRVDQMQPYFERFTAKFPTIFKLAQADQQEVLSAWEGLGYYSRARNLHHTARTVVESFGGAIPDTWDELRALKGVGDYTAAAVLSIAYHKPHAVVDGNVIRVVSRYLGIADDVRSAAVRKRIQDTVSRWIPAKAPSDFNQAMMELGSQVCKPSNPQCRQCPLQAHCVASLTARTDTIPYKSPAAKVPHVNVVVGIIQDESNRVLIARRPDDVMLGGLWEFPGGKQESGELTTDTLHRELYEELGVKVGNVFFFHRLKHAYSHFKITLHAYTCSVLTGSPTARTSSELKWVSVSELDDYPFPKANRELTRLLNRRDDNE